MTVYVRNFGVDKPFAIVQEGVPTHLLSFHLEISLTCADLFHCWGYLSSSSLELKEQDFMELCCGTRTGVRKSARGLWIRILE